MLMLVMMMISSPPSSSSPRLLLRWRLHVSLLWICSSILLSTCLLQIFVLRNFWPIQWRPTTRFFPLPPPGSGPAPPPPPSSAPSFSLRAQDLQPATAPTPHLSTGIYKSNGFLKVSCNGGLNQMRAAICDMVTVAYLLNLTLVVPELDKASFWDDTSNFGDIFDVRHFVDSLRNKVHVTRRLPKRLTRRVSNDSLMLLPVSWSTDKYYLRQILPLAKKYHVIHFKKTDARLANNGLPLELQKLRCHVNYQALKFTPQIEALGKKLVDILRAKGHFVALHLRYEMDMLAFSGCTHGCSEEEAEELKRMRYAYPWWREKEINSESKRSQGLCPLTPEETSLVLQGLGFDNSTRIYIASGEIYGGNRRLEALWASFPQLVKKETLLDPGDLDHFKIHSSQMAALDYMVSLASDVFIPTFDGNMAKVVEGHRRYLGFKKSISLDRRKVVQLVDLYANKSLPWNQFAAAVREAHEMRVGQPSCRRVVADKPKEEDYFYANPHECLINSASCHKPWHSPPSR